MARKKSFKIKNTFTFILAVIIIIVAIVLYLHKTDFKFSTGSSSNSATMIGDGDNATGILKIHFIDIGQGDWNCQHGDHRNLLRCHDILGTELRRRSF